MKDYRLQNKETVLYQRLIDCNDTVLNLDDAALFLGKSRGAVLKLCQRGHIPAHKQNKTWWLLKSEVVSWLRNR